MEMSNFGIVKKASSLLFVIVFAAACAQTAPPVERNYISVSEPPSANMSVAVLPFDNWTAHPKAGQIVAQLLASELYSRGMFDLREVPAAGENATGASGAASTTSMEDARKAAARLNVDAVIVGSVSEYGYKHSLNEEPAVGLNLRLVSARTGAVMWAASHSVIGTDKQRESVNQAAQRAIGLMVQGLADGFSG